MKLLNRFATVIFAFFVRFSACFVRQTNHGPRILPEKDGSAGGEGIDHGPIVTKVLRGCHSVLDCRHNFATLENSSLRRSIFLGFCSSFPPLFWADSFGAPVFADVPSLSNECQNGRIVSESSVPGAYQQKCMDLNERNFLLVSSGDTITVHQGTNAEGGMAGRTGVALWNSGILLARLLDKLSQSNPNIFKEKSILELGCGVSLATIAVSKLGAAHVVATDANPEVLALAQRNIERNNVSGVATTATLHWGLIDASEYDSTADIIIGSDLTYNSGSWGLLAETMATALRPEGIVIYLTLGHSGFNVGGELGGFLAIADNIGLSVLTKDSERWKENIGSQSIDDLLRNVISPEESNVIDANGGARAVILGKKKLFRKG